MLSEEQLQLFKEEQRKIMQGESFLNLKTISASNYDNRMQLYDKSLKSKEDPTAWYNSWGRNFWNGVKDGGKSLKRASIGATKAIKDLHQHEMNELHNSNREDYGLVDALADEEMAVIRGADTSDISDQFAYLLGEQAGRIGVALLAQRTGIAAVPKALAAVGASVSPSTGKTLAEIIDWALIWLDIAGNTYLDKKAEGVDSDTALKASLGSATLQTPVEGIGRFRMFRTNPYPRGILQKAKNVGVTSAAEGATESIQRLMEQGVDIYSRNPDLTYGGDFDIWKENLGDNIKDIALSGGVGAFFGGFVETGKIGVSSSVDLAYHKLSKSVNEKITKARVEVLDKNIQFAKETSEPLDAIRETIDAANFNQHVMLDGPALNGYAQIIGVDKVAEALGVSKKDLEKAAQAGSAVETSIGAYVTAVKQLGDGMHDSLKNNISFESGEYTISEAKLQEEAQRDYEAAAAEGEEFERIMGDIDESAREAGINSKERFIVGALLRRFYMTVGSENPAEYARKHHLGFKRMVRTKQGNYIQFQPWELRLDKEDKSFSQNLEKVVEEIERKKRRDAEIAIAKRQGVPKDQLPKEYTFKIEQPLTVMTTPLVLKFAGAETLPLTLSIKKINHIFKKHGESKLDSGGITLDDLKNIPKALADPVMVIRQSNGNIGVLLELKNKRGSSIYQAITLSKKEINPLGESGAKSNRIATVFDIDSSGNYGKSEVDYILDKSKGIRENFLYINKNDARKWLESTRHTFPQTHLADIISDASIPDKQELIKLRKENIPLAYRIKEKQLGTYLKLEKEGKHIIGIFEGHNVATVVHETAHYFFDCMWQDIKDGIASEKNLKDFNALLKYANITMEEWQNADFEGRRMAHERWAQAFETYMMEGKAPTRTLRKLFSKVRKWMVKVYENLIRLQDEVPLTDEVREVFDSMLASEGEIALQKKTEGIFKRLPDYVTANLSESSKIKLEEFIDNAEEKAEQLIIQRKMKDFSKERKEEIIRFRKGRQEDIENAVSQQKIYRVSSIIEANIGNKKYPTAASIARRYLDPDGKAYFTYKNEVSDVEKEFSLMVQPIIEACAADPAASENGWPRQRSKQEKIAIDVINGVATYYPPGYEHFKNRTGANVERERAKLKILNDNREMLKSRNNDGLNVREWSKNSLTADERNLFDIYAEQAGYSSGDSLAKEILTKPSYKQEVKRIIDSEVQQRYPDVTRERTLRENAIREALHNEDSALLIAAEYDIILNKALRTLDNQYRAEERSKTIAATKQSFRQKAVEYLESLPIKDAIKHRQFAKYEFNEARLADKALLEGNDSEAARHKSNQLYWHIATMESIRMEKKLQTYKKYIKRQRDLSKDTWERLGKNNKDAYKHFNQIGALLERIGLRRKDYAAEAKTQTLQEYVDDMNNLFGTVDIAEWLLDETQVIPPMRELNFNQVLDIVRAFQNIRALAKTQHESILKGVKKTWEKIREELLEKLKVESNPNPSSSEDKSIVSKAKEKAKKVWKVTRDTVADKSLMNSDSLFLELDNWEDNGWWYNNLYLEIKHACDQIGFAQEKIRVAQMEALNKYASTSDDKKRIYKKVEYDELGTDKDGNKHSLDKIEIIQFILNMGNEGNFTRLASSRPVDYQNSALWVIAGKGNTYSREEAIAITKKNLVGFINKYCDARDLEYAQSMLDAAGMFYDEQVKLEIDTKGFPPKTVKATPILFTFADGQKVTFKGGYYPLVRDNRYPGRGKQFSVEGESGVNKPGRGELPLLTCRDSMKERKLNAEYPVDLRIEAGKGSIDNAIRDLYLRKIMQKYNRIFNDAELYAAMENKFGPDNCKLLREFLTNSSWPGRSLANNFAEQKLQRKVDWLRRKTINYALVFRLKPVVQNFENILYYGNSIEGFTYTDALFSFLDMLKFIIPGSSSSYSKDLEFCKSKSALMTSKHIASDMTLREMRLNENFGPKESKIATMGYRFLTFTDLLTAIPVWKRAYFKKIAAGTSEQEAIDFADAVIRRTLGSSRPNDAASFLRMGRVYRIFNMYQEFNIAQHNQARRQWNRTIKGGNKSEAAMFAVIKRLLPTAIAVSISNALFDSDKDEESNFMAEVFKEMAVGELTIAGMNGQILGAFLGKFIGLRGTHYRATPLIATIDKFYSATPTFDELLDLWEEDGLAGILTSDRADELLDVMAFGLGVPGQFGVWGGNLKDAAINDMTLEWRDLFRRRPKSERE